MVLPETSAPPVPPRPRSRLYVEVMGLGAALLAVDRAMKAAEVRLLQAELNDLCGVIFKLEGDVAAVKHAAEVCEQIGQRLRVDCVTSVIAAPEPAAEVATISPPEFQPLLDQEAVYMPTATNKKADPSLAIGLIETQGFTAVLDAIDTACKAGDVTVLGKEKLGGGYVTVLIQGNVAAVEAAVAAGKQRVEKLGVLIAAHVIARPSPEILSLLPE